MMDTFNILPKYIEFWLKVINYFCLNEIMVGYIPGILYPARLSFRIVRERKNFSDKQKLKEYNNTTSTLQEILKDLF